MYIFRTLYLFSYFSTFFVNIIMTIIFSPCSFSLLIIGDDPLFREQAVASFVGLMFDLLSEDLLDIRVDASFCGLIFNSI